MIKTRLDIRSTKQMFSIKKPGRKVPNFVKIHLSVSPNILNRPICQKDGQNKGNKPNCPKSIILDEEGRKNSPSDKTPNQGGHKEGFPEKLHLALPHKIPVSDHGLLEIPCHKGMVVSIAIDFSKGNGYNPQAQSKERHDQNIGHFFWQKASHQGRQDQRN